MIDNPFFSIIVVSFNAELYISKTIESVLKQDFDNYEIIVKDGLSTDNTLERIPKSEKIKVFSKKDSGIYDAMNQAIELSSGDYICFLNCGDYFCDENVLAKIYDVAKSCEDSVVYGDYSRKGILFKQPTVITDFYLYRTPLCHQTMFIAKNLFSKNGLYNTEYKILADYEHTLHDYFSGAEFVHCDVNVCDYMGGGASETAKGIEIKKSERDVVLKKYYKKSKISKYNLMLKLSCKTLRQKLVGDRSPKLVRKLYRFAVNKINK